ncbi:extensin-like [Homarus americanus]|uniref:DNA-directed RNA polymerase II subunit RPB1-like 20 n=1 Tax=Homarus americanus TaxID=6706 RepID=A0A8J5JSN3_HOMAM|nr:extensin-like [Homarus americanus]KAG7161328.1 DNA-directed RNA polymerase II subunit RPB1-like 20 [Homarus americanus]
MGLLKMMVTAVIVGVVRGRPDDAPHPGYSYPVPPPPAYGPPAPAYGPPAPAYGPPAPAYDHPTPAYGPPAPAYAHPTPAYGPPAPAYGPPAPAYAHPTPAYGPPAPAYGSPAPAYAPEPAYAPPAPAYGTPAPAYAPPSHDNKGMPYDFAYGVKDDYTGNNYGHNENSDGNTVTGEYSVLLPDSRTQIVTYTADHYKGYIAEVRYEGEARYDEPQHYAPKYPVPSYKPAPVYGSPSA